MKRIVAWLLTLGILAIAAPTRADKDDEKKDVKKVEKKDDKKKDDKKKDDKKAEKKAEEKISDDQKRDLDSLSGTFTVTLFEHDGKQTSADDLKKMKVTQKGAEWTFQFGDDITQGKDKVYTDKKPKQIDSLYTSGAISGQSVLGIYEISNDTIKYCWRNLARNGPRSSPRSPTPASRT